MSTPDTEFAEPDPKQLLLQALARRWENYLAELKNCQGKFNEESVHDLRVATRRILALIRLLNSISPHSQLKKIARVFKDQLDEFDNLRDTQVILAELAGTVDELPQLEDFELHLRSQEAQMLEDLGARLRDRKTSGLEKWIRKIQEDVDAWGEKELKPLILEAVDDAYLTVRQRLGWVDLARPATIHRVRVAFKAFRYMVEIVHPLVQNFPPGLLKQMDDYQTLMGNIQDAEVFAQTFASFTRNASFRDLDAVQRYYGKRRAEAISTYAGARNQLHIFWRPTPEQPFPWQ